MAKVKLKTDEVLSILEIIYYYERSPKFKSTILANDKKLRTFRAAKKGLESAIKLESVKL